MYGTKEAQQKSIRYYDKISGIYDLISNWYYRKARSYAIKELEIKRGNTILNLPCGTGVSLKYFNEYLNNSGLVIGIDLSKGMLEQAKRKTEKNGWTNIQLELKNATEIDEKWLADYSQDKVAMSIDSIFCDLGVSVLPEWQKTIDNMLSVLNPNGRIVILDWYLEEPGLLAEFVKWVGKGEVDRPIWQYLNTKVSDFEVERFGLMDGVFVASGTKPEGKASR